MAKKKKKFPIFVITLVIGLGLIGFSLFEADFDVSALTSFGVITVPIDPTTGGILGTIILGAPDVIPFEQAGTMIGKPTVSSNFPQNRCTDNLTGGTQLPLLPPDFGRRLSGERNQLDPVWWGSTNTGITNSYNCGFAYAQFDIVDIPNDFVATSVVFKLEILEARGIRNTNNPSQECRITIQDFNIDTIGDAGVIDKLYNSGFPVVSRGTWCNKIGVNTFQFNQGAVDLINDAISGGAFDQGVRSDKLLLGFLPHRFDNIGTGQNRLSTDYWKTEGSLFLTGSSSPIKCNVGFNQVDFRCIPIVCVDGERVNPATNECEPIMCAEDEQLIGNICTPVICEVGEQAFGGTCIAILCDSSDVLVGSECVPLLCDSGFEAVDGECVIKSCPTGFELVQDTCQPIVCPTDFVLSGSNCLPKQCPSGELSYNNECRNTVELCDLGVLTCDPPDPPILECPTGFIQVDASCVISPENCPEGTEPKQNVCVQKVPDLLMISGISPPLFLILGLVIAGMSGIGIVVRRRG